MRNLMRMMRSRRKFLLGSGAATLGLVLPVCDSPPSERYAQAVIELLRNREDIFYNYSVEVFERLLSKKVKIANRHIISESGRVLFEFIKK